MSYNHQEAKPKRLLPDQLHDVFRIEINRLNDKHELITTDNNLFDSYHETNNNNKYKLPSVYIGEIWRFRIKISNRLNENLYNFGLLCHIEMIGKGSTNGNQLYPRPRELCPTQFNKNDNITIDLEYPVTLNESSLYSLIFTITASNKDNMSQLYKNIFEFHSVPCISLTFQKQTLDENLFVEALINNVSNQPKLPFYVNVNFKCLGLFKSYNLTHHDNTQKNNDDKQDNKQESKEILLNPMKEKNILFQIEMKNPTSLVNLNALSVGQIEIKWKSISPFRQGIFLSDIIQRRSLFCKKLSDDVNIEILILKCPSNCIVHNKFNVTFHIFNLDRYSHKIWLSIDKNTSGYLLPYGVSKKYLGTLETSSSIKTDMTLIAFAPGIHVLTGIVITTQPIQSSINMSHSNKNTTKHIHYESTQYIYIDIDEEFHKKKLKEKEERQKKLMILNKSKEDEAKVNDVVDINLDDNDDVKKDQKDKPQSQSQPTPTLKPKEKETEEIVKKDITEKKEDDQDPEVKNIDDKTGIDTPKENEIENTNDDELEQQTRHRRSFELSKRPKIEPPKEEIKPTTDVQAQISTQPESQIEAESHTEPEPEPPQQPIEEEENKLDTEQQETESMTISATIQTEIEQEAQPTDINKLEPSPKHKPIIPPSSDLKPIGVQKTEDEIAKEVQAEEKQQMSSLRPLKSTEFELSGPENEVDTAENIDGNDVEKENDITEEVEDDAEENIQEDLDVAAMEIEQDDQEQQQIEENKEDDNQNEEAQDVNNTDNINEEQQQADENIRDLGAQDPNESTISVAISDDQ